VPITELAVSVIADPNPWWVVIAPIVALIGAVAGLRGSQGKRHRNEQQAELLGEMAKVKAALEGATAQRDRIAAELADEQRKCSNEAAAMRAEIEKNGEVMAQLLRMKR
jgi:hypothetical protein